MITEGGVEEGRSSRLLQWSSHDHLTPPEGLNFNTRLQMDGVELLRDMDSACAAAVFLDPQYDPAPGVRLMVGKLRAFTRESRRVLRAGGYLFLWIKKRHIVSREWHSWLPGDLSAVDLITWDTGRDAHSTTAEPSWTTPHAAYLIVAQRPPRNPSSGWERQAIPDVWHEEPIEHPLFSPTPPGLLGAADRSVHDRGRPRDRSGCRNLLGAGRVPRKGPRVLGL